MSAFLAGVVFGALFVGSLAVIFFTGVKRSQRELDDEIVEWTDEEYTPPPIATTRILIKERHYVL